MESFIDFENIDTAEEFANWDISIDFNDGNIIDGLATPNFPCSPLFEPLAPDVPHGQQEQAGGEGEQGQSTTTEIDQIVIADDHNGNNNVAAATSLMSPNGEVISTGNSATELAAASSSLPPITLEDFEELGAAANLTHHQPSNAAVDVSNFQPLLPPILNGTQMPATHSSPVVGLGSERSAGVPSAQVQEVPLMTDYLNLSSRARNELLNTCVKTRLQARGEQTENGVNNVPNVVANANNTNSGANYPTTNNTFSGANYQTSSYPSLYQQNPQADAGAGLGGRMPIPEQRNRFLSQQAQTNGPHTAWNSNWPQYNQSSTANAHDSQIPPSYNMQHDPSPYNRSQQFTGLMQQGGQVLDMQTTMQRTNYDAPYGMQQHDQQGSHVPGMQTTMQRTYDAPYGMQQHDQQGSHVPGMQTTMQRTYDAPYGMQQQYDQQGNHVPGMQTTMQRTYDAPYGMQQQYDQQGNHVPGMQRTYDAPYGMLQHDQQGSHVPGMQTTYDAPYGMQQHAYPMHHEARQEPYSYQSTLGSMPQNGYDNQLGYGSNVPEPAYPPGPSTCQKYPSQPQNNPYGITYNSMPQRQPLNYDNHRSHYRGQNSMPSGLGRLCSNQNSMPSCLGRLCSNQNSMPNGLGRLGSRSFQLSGALPLRATETRNEGSRQRGQSSKTQRTATLARLTNSQVQEVEEPSGSIVLSSRSLEPERAGQKVQEPTASTAVNSRPSEPLTSSGFQFAPTVQPQIAASSNRDVGEIAGIAQSASSSRPNAVDELCHPEDVQPISTSVPTATDIPPTKPPLTEEQKQTILGDLRKALKKRNVETTPGDTRDEQQKPRRGRPPKRAENGGSPSSSKRPKLQLDTANNPSQAPRTSEYEGKQNENDNATIPILLRGVPTTVYDRIFEGKNLPVDPHLRMLQSEKK